MNLYVQKTEYVDNAAYLHAEHESGGMGVGLQCDVQADAVEREHKDTDYDEHGLGREYGCEHDSADFEEDVYDLEDSNDCSEAERIHADNRSIHKHTDVAVDAAAGMHDAADSSVHSFEHLDFVELGS